MKPIKRVRALRDLLENIYEETITSTQWEEDASVTWELPWSKHDNKPALRMCYDGFEFTIEVRDETSWLWKPLTLNNTAGDPK